MSEHCNTELYVYQHTGRILLRCKKDKNHSGSHGCWINEVHIDSVWIEWQRKGSTNV